MSSRVRHLHSTVIITKAEIPLQGIGLGAILSRVSSVTDSMIEAASLGLANSLTHEERGLELVYPRIERIRDISAQIALSVIRAAQNAVSDLLHLVIRLLLTLTGRTLIAHPTSANSTTRRW